MRVLYLSKALTVASYRDKLREMSQHIEVTAVIPERWGPHPPEEGDADSHPVTPWPVWMHAHNHLHVYVRPSALLRRFEPDLVHVDEEPYSAVTFQMARVCRSAGVPVVFFAWQNIDKRIPPPFGMMQRFVFNTCAGAIAGTETAAEVLRGNGCPEPIAVIPQFGVDTGRFTFDLDSGMEVRSRLGLPSGAFIVGFAGRLVPEKGIGVLLRAVAETQAVRLVILGDGPEHGRIRREADDLGIADRTVLVGGAASLEMPAWLTAMAVLVLPSVSTPRWVEQFGRILIEAMACGLPVVASDSGEMPKVVGDAGLIVPEGDAQALARALAALAESPERRRRIGEAGRVRVCERYAQRPIAEATVAFYERVLSMRSATA